MTTLWNPLGRDIQRKIAKKPQGDILFETGIIGTKDKHDSYTGLIHSGDFLFKPMSKVDKPIQNKPISRGIPAEQIGKINPYSINPGQDSQKIENMVNSRNVFDYLAGINIQPELPIPKTDLSVEGAPITPEGKIRDQTGKSTILYIVAGLMGLLALYYLRRG